MVQADLPLPRIVSGPAAPTTALPERFPSGGEEAARLTERLGQAAQVAGRLCHDYGNMLTGVLGFSELAAAHVAEDELSLRTVSFDRAEPGHVPHSRGKRKQSVRT